MRCESLDDTRYMELFELAAHVPPDARRRRLLEACDGDEELAEGVVIRVNRHDGMGDFLLQSPILRLATELRFAPGDLVASRFHIVRELGEGGMGVVYEALDEKLQHRCALKCPKPGFARQLPGETSTALSITHDNVCRAYGIYTGETPHGAVDVLVMEYLEGETLTQRVARLGPLDDRTARDVVLQLCAGLQTAHNAGVIHRDLKSHNIMLTEDRAGRLRAVITDFGLAGYLAEDSAAGSGVMAGTLPFMAPELLEGGRASEGSDIYALGVVMYEMVTGRLPDRAQYVPPSEIVAGLDRRWDRIIASCLGPREQRPKAADHVARVVRGRSRAAAWATRGAAAAVISMGLYAAVPDPPPVRLAVLPFDVAGDDQAVSTTAGGLLHDVSRRLGRLENGNDSLLIIPLAEATRHRVTTPQQAGAALGATHALVGRISRTDGGYNVIADVVDVRTSIALRHLQADYARDHLSEVPGALAGIVTGAFALRRDPGGSAVAPPAYAAFVEGMFELRAGLARAGAAIEHLSRAAALDTASALPPAALAEAYLNKFQDTRDSEWLTRAETSLAIAQRRDPDELQVLLASGRFNRAASRYDPSISDFTRAIQLAPKSVQAWLGLARTYGDAGRTADAATAFQKAIDLQPEYYLPHFEFGTFYYVAGQYELGEKHLQRAIALAPDNAPSFGNLGALYVDRGRFDEAERMLQRSIELLPSRASFVSFGAARNYQRRDPEALKLYRRALAQFPPTFELMVNIGDTSRRLGLEPESITAYRSGLDLVDAGLKLNPGNGYMRAFAAYFMARLKRPDDARRDLEQALGQAQANQRVLHRAALVFETLGDRAATLHTLRNASPQVLDELSRHPDLERLVSDPQFQALVRASR